MNPTATVPRPSRAPRRPLLLLAAPLALLLAACAGEPAGPERVEEVVLSHDSLVLAVGEQHQLSATVRGAGRVQLVGRPVEWSSSDPARAAVEAGLVRGVAPGRALVVASVDGRADTARVVVAAAGPRQEARALWVNRFEYGADLGPAAGAARIAAILDRARQANFNLVYFQVRGQGDAYYRSALEPCAIALCGRLGKGQPAWDPLEVAIREAHARGLQLHAWLNAFSGFSAPASNPGYCANLASSAPGSPTHMLLEHPDWAVVDAAGARESCESSARQGLEYLYVSPGIPAARTHLARVAADVARRYAGLDGVHLDRIRYPGPGWSHDAASLRAFGRPPAADPDGWARFRREQVNLAVREVHDSLRAARPGVVLSAAVWGIHDRTRFGWTTSSGIHDYFQDARAWASGGFLDVAVPMTYFAINDARCSVTGGNPDWACLLEDHLQGVQGATGRHLYIGIAANRGAAQVERQVRLGREKGAKGFALYAYTALESNGLWTVLGSGVFREPATVPPMEWR